MDDFSVDQPELSGALLELEFGKGGRIRQMWVTDPSRPQGGESSPLIIPSLSFGEEQTDDFFPGTIMIGARTHPEEPWIVSRNQMAQHLDAPSDSDDDDFDEPLPTKATFAYEFPLLPEVSAKGTFSEVQEPIPHIVWDIEIKNVGNGGLEIGELAFPFAFDNFLEVQGRSQDPGEIWNEHYAIHKCLGGAASYLHIQRLNGDPPGLAVLPGEATTWEFFTHVPSSLNTGFRWEGIPVVYVHSRATVEREHWAQWIYGHSSLTLERGEIRKYQLKFVPTDRERRGGLQSTLSAMGHPVFRLWPGAVVPVGVDLQVDVSGTTPAQFHSDREVTIEPDSFEGGGACTLRTAESGAITLSCEDVQGRSSHAELLYVDPIEELINRRAQWVMDNQVCTEPTNLYGALVNTDHQVGVQMAGSDEYDRPFGIRCSLSEALFLAEKNFLEPNLEQIEMLDQFLEEYLFDDLQNPKTLEVGSIFVDSHSIALGPDVIHARMVQWLLSTFSKIASVAPSCSRSAEWYSERAGQMAALMQRLPDFDPSNWDVDMLWRLLDGDGPVSGERLVGMLSSTKSAAPCWWWYGSDRRILKDTEVPHPAMLDKGEMCLGPSTPLNSLLILELARQKPEAVPDWMINVAFGGLLGIWALVRPDGAAAMGYCPDSASRHFGMSWYTGDVGLTLWYYLRSISSHVYPLSSVGPQAFGCSMETREEGEEDWLSVRPWDGVGRRIIVHDWNIDVTSEGARILQFDFETRKRKARIVLKNPGDLARNVEVTLAGMWGNHIMLSDKAESHDVSQPIIRWMEPGAELDLAIQVAHE